MADMITIEGSLTPSVELPRGQRRTVVRTERIERLIARGYIVEVPSDTGTTSDSPAPAEPVHAPAEPEVVAAEPEPEAAEPVKSSRSRAAAKPADGE
ncbi:hypothetical protein TPA2_gp30 [Tsukamurella phage TPA2]|uniref:hypothetical protein n=1 Tax=Tsukamurella phage TPA2 TaxID=981330 RepID=UPI0001FF8DB5|nr:hypothetical protein TPA2_gp30 [Tsukamurella phage TPA2]ADX31944.1 hypothetical protein [Tsukamurella phage TPA2]